MAVFGRILPHPSLFGFLETGRMLHGGGRYQDVIEEAQRDMNAFAAAAADFPRDNVTDARPEYDVAKVHFGVRCSVAGQYDRVAQFGDVF